MNTSVSVPSAQIIRPSTHDTSTRIMGHLRLFAHSVWWGIAILNLVVFILAIPIRYQQLTMEWMGSTFDIVLPLMGDASALATAGLSLDVYAFWMIVMQVVSTTAYLIAGGFIFWKKSHDRWGVFSSLLLMTLGCFTGIFPIQLGLATESLLGFVVVHTLKALSWFILMMFLYMFPDGHFVPHKARWGAILVGLTLFIPAFLPQSPINPYTGSFLTLFTQLVIVLGPGIVAQVYRYRYHASLTQRQQTKWIMYVSVIGFTTVVCFPVLFAVIFPSVGQAGLLHLGFNIAYATILTLTSLMFVFGIGFSILRYRLWEIDLVINRSLVYGGLSLILGIVFAASIVVIQQIVGIFNGGMQSPIALGLATLFIGALFQPARRNLQHIVDKRFFGIRLNLQQFTARTTSFANPVIPNNTLLGPYQIIEPIGKGGMGEVYRAFQPSLGRYVAIKVLPAHLASDETFRARFEREARAVGNLQHPNIVHVFDFGQMDDLYYMVMELVEGESLADNMRMFKRLVVDDVRAIISDVAAALDHAHGHGLVHRDIKPSNVMLRVNSLTPSGHEESSERCMQAILMDFGIAKIQDGLTGLTGSGIMGTPDYVSPEQIASSRDVDYHSDIYGLGIMAYQMLTGELPYSGGVAQVIFGHMYKPAPDVRDIVPDVPDSIAKAIAKAMSKTPDERFHSAGAFAVALRL